MDVTQDGIIVFNSGYSIYTFPLKRLQNSNGYNLNSISVFDTNKKGCLIFGGPMINETDKIRIVYKASKNEAKYLSKDLSQKDISILTL